MQLIVVICDLIVLCDLKEPCVQLRFINETNWALVWLK